MQTTCATCKKTVRAGGVELGDVLFCGPCFGAHAQATKAAREVKAPVEAKSSAQPVKRERCAWASTVREFHAVAKEKGLDVSNKMGARVAIGLLLGREVKSRADLGAADWGRAVGAMRDNRLWW